MPERNMNNSTISDKMIIVFMSRRKMKKLHPCCKQRIKTHPRFDTKYYGKYQLYANVMSPTVVFLGGGGF